MAFAANTDALSIMERTLNFIDARLFNHGRRVAHTVYKLLWPTGKYSLLEMRDICIVALLHDIGAYKTEEIDRMVSFEAFETQDTWDHAIYGYLFLKYFSPIGHLAPVILHHHTSCEALDISSEMAWLSQVFFIADRMDILAESGVRDKVQLLRRVRGYRGGLFCDEVIELAENSGLTLPVQNADVEDGSEIHQMLHAVPLTAEERQKFLRMIVLFIDLRSHHTMTHTVATTAISEKLAGMFGVEGQALENLLTGSWLHDIGKTGVPLYILEKPTPLSYNEMEIVRRHVRLTDTIIQGCVPEEARRIAAHHHEKLDGSGYPEGLAAEAITTSERIAVVADIFSALCGERSYKSPFPQKRVLQILGEMRDKDLLVMEAQTRPYEEAFGFINEEFWALKNMLPNYKESECHG